MPAPDNEPRLCRDCLQPFTLEQREIEWYLWMQSQNPETFAVPRRCPACRRAARERRLLGEGA
jgi:hypothetical protein